ncbi:regulator RcnB of Ni and Co efflux [Collimonas sp. OK242]|jgi:Ni/Co efflux regulator RcnB|uniref:RcnB family protein n=1 Tax=Collimonas sp. OK242 TaxID=1798195 RepID=UPI00089AC70F|nr:RcnB family protein [Collimonas sp. OK242]SDY54591.1 regulator RcnB of Ni and Co efflux [Collimonas sp. OK242]
MDIKPIVCAVMAITLAAGGSAGAQNYGDRNDHQQRAGQGDNRDNRDDRDNRGRQQEHRDNRDNQGRQQDRRDNRDYGQANRDRQGERGAGPNHEFYRGQRLPPEYRDRQYVVDDWRGHHLRAPPRGYRWVQVGGDYVLVAISNGIILQLFLGD